MRVVRRLRGLALCAVVLAGAASCASSISGTGLRAGATVPGTPSPGPIDFRDCTDQLLGLGVKVPKQLDGTVRFGCATLDVPVDYSRPDGPRLSLAVLRVHTTQNTRVPVQSLLVNPGGPGGSGVNFGLGLVSQLSVGVLRAYDIIAFDPRGVAESTPVRCLSNAAKDRLFAATFDMTTRRGVEQSLALDRRVAADCTRNAGPDLPYINTVETARDMDQIRQGVGDDVMNYLGFSYGTELGWVYAHLFPKLVHTFVLDGAVDPTQVNRSGSTVQLRGFEQAFGQFSNWCRHAPACSSLGSPADAVRGVFAAARRAPLHTGSTRALTESLASTGVLEALYSRDEWPRLASALTAAARGDGSGLLSLADRYDQRKPDGTYTNLFDANLAINCNDTPVQPTPAIGHVLSRARALARQYPLFGADQAAGLLGCAGWQPHRTPLPPPSAATPRPVLVVGNLHDPATPYTGAVHLAHALGNARVLTWNGQGHTSYLEGSSCIDHYVNDYLIHGALPPRHKVCPAK